MAWVYAFPAWAAVLLFVGGLAALAVAGLLLYQRFGKDESVSHNDVAGPLIGTAGTILAVMLSLMLVGVWQEYDASATVVSSEAAALADVVRLSHLMAPAQGAALRTEVIAYTDAIVKQEWDAMRAGGSSSVVRSRGQALLLHVTRLHDPAMQQFIVTAIDARRTRLAANQQAIPAILWWAMFFTGATTIFLTYLFRVEHFGVHLGLTAALAAIVGVVFLAIAELDLPFMGPFGIGPDAFTTVYTAASL